MGILKTVSNAWSAINNLGVGSKDDPLKNHYGAQGVLGAVVVKDADRKKRDIELEEGVYPYQLQCQGKEVILACEKNMINDPQRFICPTYTNDTDGEAGHYTPVPCAQISHPDVVDLIAYSPQVQVDGQQNGDCDLRAAFAQVDVSFWYSEVCPKFPYGVSSICYSNSTCYLETDTGGNQLTTGQAMGVGVGIGAGIIAAFWGAKSLYDGCVSYFVEREQDRQQQAAQDVERARILPLRPIRPIRLPDAQRLVEETE